LKSEEKIENLILRGYCYLRNNALECRRIDLFFLILFVLQIALLVNYGIDWQLKSLQINTVGSLLTTLLTTALVYVYLGQRPELRLIGFLVEPKDASQKLVCKDQYKEHLYHEMGIKEEILQSIAMPSREQIKHAYSQYFPVEKKIVECKRPPELLVIRNDITNLGSSTTRTHEYQFEQIQPVKRKGPKVIFREMLEHQQRQTILAIFPNHFEFGKKVDLVDGLYEFKLTVYTATKKCVKRIWILVSQKATKIEWSESRFHRFKT
jgi:hypothetical protein